MWTWVGSDSEALNNTSSPTCSTARTCSAGEDTATPATNSRYAPESTSTCTSLPSLVHAGTPRTSSTQSLSVSVCTGVSDPSVTSTANTRSSRGSRDCTPSSGAPAVDQCTLARYSHSAECTSTREPSSPNSASETCALSVPAAG